MFQNYSRKPSFTNACALQRGGSGTDQETFDACCFQGDGREHRRIHIRASATHLESKRDAPWRVTVFSYQAIIASKALFCVLLPRFSSTCAQSWPHRFFCGQASSIHDLGLIKLPRAALMFPNPPSLTRPRNPRSTRKEFVRKAAALAFKGLRFHDLRGLTRLSCWTRGCRSV
jgi:hypothetical protein